MTKKLTQLGKQVAQPASPDKAVLEAVPNPHPGSDYVVRFTAPEFTSLCPITGQPDFAHFVIDYVPGKAIVESKSLKLFLGSFRNVGAFHEDCSPTIGKRRAIGIRAAECRSTSSGRTASCPRASGCPIRVSRPIAAAAELRLDVNSETAAFAYPCVVNA